MEFNTDKFISGIVAVVVATIVITAVAIPVINGVVIPEGTANAGALETIIGILPVFMIIAVLLACVYLFMSKRKN